MLLIDLLLYIEKIHKKIIYFRAINFSIDNICLLKMSDVFYYFNINFGVRYFN